MESGIRNSFVTRRAALLGGAAMTGAAAIGMPAIVRAQEKTIPFTLDIRIYGGNCPFLLGEEQGIYKELGYSLAIDGSPGSAESVRRVATGTHDFGFADISTLVEFAARNPKAAPKAILSIFDHFPACLISMNKRPIEKPKDLEGARIGVGAASGATKLLPALLKLNDVDESKIEYVTVDVKLRDSLLLRNEIDAIIGFDYTSIFNLVEAGANQDDIGLLYYSDYGFNFPAQSLIASQRMLEEQPDLCKAMALGAARAWKAAYKDPAAAVAAVVKRESLLQEKVELPRFQWVLDKHIMTENVKQNGLGYVDPARMEKGSQIIKEGFELDEVPELSLYYDDRFLPAASELKMI